LLSLTVLNNTAVTVIYGFTNKIRYGFIQTETEPKFQLPQTTNKKLPVTMKMWMQFNVMPRTKPKPKLRPIFSRPWHWQLWPRQGPDRDVGYLRRDPRRMSRAHPRVALKRFQPEFLHGLSPFRIASSSVNTIDGKTYTYVSGVRLIEVMMWNT